MASAMPNDEAYENARFIPGGADYADLWATRARQFREIEAAVGRARLNQSYGPDPRQKFDLFYPAGRPEGLVVLIHGGYWLRFGREDFSHLARGATLAGWACALPSYRLAPQASLAEIARDAAAATEAAAGLVAGPIALTGHSAGGQLSARLVCTDSPLSEAVRPRISAVVPVSPLADLRPFLQNSMNAGLRLDPASAEAESPMLHTPRAGVPVSVWVGGDERPAFLDQARWLAEAWPGTGLHIEPGQHHFNVIEAYEDPESALVGRLIGRD